MIHRAPTKKRWKVNEEGRFIVARKAEDNKMFMASDPYLLLGAAQNQATWLTEKTGTEHIVIEQVMTDEDRESISAAIRKEMAR